MKTGCLRILRGLLGFVAVAVLLAVLAGALSLFLFNVILTTEEVVVPDVVNMRVEEAISVLSRQGLGMEPVIDRYNEEVEPGLVIRQHPEANRKVKKDRRIQLYRSLGSQMVPIPNCAGLSLSDTHLQIQIAGLESGRHSYAHHATIPRGNIITTSPMPGGKARKSQTCDLLISLGPPPPAYVMPDVTGRYREEATEGFKSIGVEVDVKPLAGQQPALSNRVVRQTPAAGERIDADTRVTLEIAIGTEEASRSALRLIRCNLPPEALKENVRIVVFDDQTPALGERIVFNADGVRDLQMTQWVWLVGPAQVIVYVDGTPVQSFNFPLPKENGAEESE